jgi:predicted glycosyltransferase
VKKKILIDINHPAHVHYFKNFIKEIQTKNFEVIVTNRDLPIINTLLDSYGIDHIIRNKRPIKSARWKSMLYLLGMIRSVLKVSLKVKPDFYIGFASPACAINSFIFRKPGIIIDDTEHNHFNHKIYSTFCTDILTPFYFEKEINNKQIRFNAFVEQFYLNSKYFIKNKRIDQSDPYCLVRFISFDAWHDIGISKNQDIEIKKELIYELSKRIKVYVSSENDNDRTFEQYKLNTHPNEMHQIIANAQFVISEGATIACEAGILGVNYYYINPLQVGNINHQVNLFEHANCCSLSEILEAVKNDKIVLHKGNMEKIESLYINPTNYLLNYVLNYQEKIK